jgi:hypothetical protein
MKNRPFSQSLLLTALTLISSLPAFGGEKGLNGGDICEDRFKIVRDDIQSWIDGGGSEGLTLPAGIRLTEYDTKMLSEFANAQVSCADAEIRVDGADKTCENFTDEHGTPQIVCNYDRFMATPPSDQYVLVHHEYAGLAGFETNDGESSQYLISNQISGYLEDQTVKKLTVKPTHVETYRAKDYRCSDLKALTQSAGEIIVQYGFFAFKTSTAVYSDPNSCGTIEHNNQTARANEFVISTSDSSFCTVGYQCSGFERLK